jgi:hippurate hydrolase
MTPSRHVRTIVLAAAGLLLLSGSLTAGTPTILANLDKLYPSLDALYLDLHRTPELSFHEEKTSAKMATRLRELGFEVTEHVGKFGVVGVLKNGPGPTVMVRTDMDALPVKEQTGLPYASTVVTKNDAGQEVGVMHACGHDIHMTSWIGAATLLARSKNLWQGTLVFIGQPAEETVEGARAMVEDGLFTRFPKPDFVIGVHDTQVLASGTLGIVSGPTYAICNSVDITFYGKGGHGATPHLTIDPLLVAARTVVTLQSIVSREIKPLDPAVVTVGTFHAGTKRNIIADEAKIELTVRSFKPEVQRHLLTSIERIAKAEATAAGVEREPSVVVLPKERSDVVFNDPDLTTRLLTTLRSNLGEHNVVPCDPQTGSEDFGVFGASAGVPSVIMFIGAAEPDVFARARAGGPPIPGTHSSKFAPDREPTIRTAVAAFTLSVMELLGAKQ